METSPLDSVASMAMGLEKVWRSATDEGQEALVAAGEAVIRYPNHPALVLKAAQLLRRSGRADLAAVVLERVSEVAGDAAVESELASLYEARGDQRATLHRRLRALEYDPFAVTNHLEAARAQMALGARTDALHTLHLMGDLDPGEPQLDAAWAGLLWRNGDAAGSIAKFERAYARGWREPVFLTEFLDLLTGETLYGRVIELEPLGEPGSSLYAYWVRTRGHAELASRADRPAILEAARAREASARWLDPAGVVGRIRQAMDRGQPLSMLRLGDGEARFLIWSTPELHAGLTREQLHTVGAVAWENWFGDDIDGVGADHILALRRDLVWAVQTADLLGVSAYARLRQDTGHFGYLAAQERFLDDVLGARGDVAMFNAMDNLELEKTRPCLLDMLMHAPFIGVISPHVELADRLQRRLRPAAMRAYVVPGEVRLSSHAGLKAERPHFPDRYQELMERIEVPGSGAVYLIAAGLLGKIYAARVKQLGGIAIDVGSLADGWMGLRTRPGLTDHVEALA